MAVKLGEKIKVSIVVDGEEVIFTLRQPSNEELNKFLESRYTVVGRKVLDRSLKARCEFFDKIIEKIENLEDENGVAITVENKEKIPASWKNDVIFKTFEDTEVNIKNS